MPETESKGHNFDKFNFFGTLGDSNSCLLKALVEYTGVLWYIGKAAYRWLKAKKITLQMADVAGRDVF